MRIFLLTTALLLSGLLTAQTAPVLETTAREVVVTGARSARPAGRSPQRITVIDSATVARAADLSQLLNEQAGVHINGAWSNPGKDRSLSLRNGGNQYTLILVDGQPLLDPSSLGGAVDLRLLDLASVQRIEILRGGASVLYGSDAVAGVVNLITKRSASGISPAPRKPTTHLRAAAASYNTQEVAANLSGSTGTLDYHGSISYLRTDGLSEALPPDSATSDFDDDGATRFAVDLGLNWRPAAGLSVRPALRVSSFAGDYDAGSFQDAANTYTNDLVNPSLAADYQRGNWTYAARYSFTGTDRVFDNGFLPFMGIGRAHQGDLFAVLNPDKGGSLTLGVQVRDEALRLNDPAIENPGVNTLSPYVQYTLATPGGFLLDAGARYNQHSKFGGQFNGALGLGVQTTPTWSSRLNLASAFQSPTLDQLAGPFGPNPELQPQVSTSLELSTRLADPAGNYRVELTGFVRQIDDLVNYVTEPENPFGIYRNQGNRRDVGVEVEGSVAIGEPFRLNGNLTYVSGELTTPGPTGDVTTDVFFRRPGTTGFLGLTFNPESPFLARLTGLYTGERSDVFFDQQFSRFETELDPYFLLNVYAEYQLLAARNLTVFGEVRNLTNTNFVEVTGFSTQGATVRIGANITL